MPEIFSSLPGIEVPVQDIASELSRLWSGQAVRGRSAPSPEDVLAMQINLILHFGFDASPEDAVHQFRTAVRFASRYPSRVVVLCPLLKESGGSAEIRAKIYGECFLGRTKEDARCCEFVLLSYSLSARPFLESQVSICLSTDLPLYYWAHRFSACHRLAGYRDLLMRARRLIFDTAIAPADALDYGWPNSAGVRDLALARILPVRQSIGQFLARTEAARIAEGLERLEIGSEPVHAAEGRALGRWARERLLQCGADAGALAVDEVVLPEGSGTCFSLRFVYKRRAKHLSWSGNCDTGIARFEADFGQGMTHLPSHISLLSPEQALAEAMFF